jgi:hypothetical protein
LLKGLQENVEIGQQNFAPIGACPVADVFFFMVA